MTASESVTLIELGPRDGFQNEIKFIPTEMKVKIIHDLVAAGLENVQVTSFVHPKYVPQMADAEKVCAKLEHRPSVAFSALVLNDKGIERAAKAGITQIELSMSASNQHQLKNAKRTMEDSIAAYPALFERASELGLKVRAGIMCCFGCVYEGAVDPAQVFRIAELYLKLGVDSITIADSTGMGQPRQVEGLMRDVMRMASGVPVVMHLHDTRGLSLVNVRASLEAGVRAFDTALGGMGGCPFIKGATGNISTEDTAYLLRTLGCETGVDIAAVGKCSNRMERFLEHDFSGKMHRVLKTQALYPELRQAS